MDDSFSNFLDTEEMEESTEVGESLMKFAFPYASVSPEEWVARNGPSSFGKLLSHRCKFRDSQLQDWTDKVAYLMRSKESIKALQRELLTKEEYEIVRADQNKRVKDQREILEFYENYFMGEFEDSQ